MRCQACGYDEERIAKDIECLRQCEAISSVENDFWKNEIQRATARLRPFIELDYLRLKKPEYQAQGCNHTVGDLMGEVCGYPRTGVGVYLSVDAYACPHCGTVKIEVGQ